MVAKGEEVNLRTCGCFVYCGVVLMLIFFLERRSGEERILNVSKFSFSFHNNTIAACSEKILPNIKILDHR